MSRELHVVGVDLSLTATGVACRHDTHLITSRGHKDDSLASRHSRMMRIREDVMTWCRHADLVVIEAPSHGSNSRANHAHDRSGLWWLITHALLSRSVPLAAVPPACRAKYATGRGNASKDEVLAAAVRRFPTHDINDNNSADALILAAMGHDALGQPLIELPATHRAALHAITWPHSEGTAA